MTELVWDGKWKDERKVGPVQITLLFQAVETVNEMAQQRQLTPDMHAARCGTEWRDRLIWGDKKYALPSFLPVCAGEVSLISIDPPLAAGADFSFCSSNLMISPEYIPSGSIDLRVAVDFLQSGYKQS